MLATSPEYKKDIKLVKFSRTYFVDFFARYGWKWGIHKGNKKYFPEQVIQDEVNPIRERIKISLQTIFGTQTKPRFLSRSYRKKKKPFLKLEKKPTLKRTSISIEN